MYRVFMIVLLAVVCGWPDQLAVLDTSVGHLGMVGAVIWLASTDSLLGLLSALAMVRIISRPSFSPIVFRAELMRASEAMRPVSSNTIPVLYDKALAGLVSDENTF